MSFAADMLRPVEGGLQPFCFDYEVMQIGGIALFDGAKLDFSLTGMISEDIVPLNCRVASPYPAYKCVQSRPGKAKPPPGTNP